MKDLMTVLTIIDEKSAQKSKVKNKDLLGMGIDSNIMRDVKRLKLVISKIWLRDARETYYLISNEGQKFLDLYGDELLDISATN